MYQFHSRLIGLCIQHARKDLQLTQKQFIKDHCTTFSLSKVEQGKQTTTKLVNTLLHEYALHQKSIFAIIEIHHLYKQLLHYVYIYDIQLIKYTLHTINALLQQHPQHIIIQEYIRYHNVLLDYYEHNITVPPHLFFYESLPYLLYELYIIFMHVYLESGLQHYPYISYKNNYQKYSVMIHSHPLFDFYHGLYEQEHYTIVDEYALYKHYPIITMRALIAKSIQITHLDTKQAIIYLEEAKNLYTQAYSINYLLVIQSQMLHIAIHQKQFENAYAYCIENHLYTCQPFIAHYILLCLLNNQPIASISLQPTKYESCTPLQHYAKTYISLSKNKQIKVFTQTVYNQTNKNKHTSYYIQLLELYMTKLNFT